MRSIVLVAASTLLALEPVPRVLPAPTPQPQQTIHLRLLDATSLEQLREAHALGSPLYHDEIAALIHECDEALRQEGYSVTRKKTKPPSGDLHDYYSWSPYWWPDPSKPDGLPYIRRDGQRNPQTLDIPDRENLKRMIAAVNTLAIGYAVTGLQKYSDHAVQLLTIWFADPETRMNPNLTYAQIIPGRAAVRGTGIIDGHRFSSLVDAITLLESSGSMSSEVRRSIRTWFLRYFEWLTTSEHGRLEKAAVNNHGTWYDVQVVAIALYLGKTEFALSVIEQAKESRIANVIAPDGSQPSELARTRSWHYSVFNLDALTRLARLAESVSVDLWTYRSDDGRSICTALKYLAPFASGTSRWPYEEIGMISAEHYADLLVRAAPVCADAELEHLATSLHGKPFAVQQISVLPDRALDP